MPPFDPVLVSIPGLNLSIRWYGVLIALGAVLGALSAVYEARRRGQDEEHVWNLLIYSLIFGLLGARLYHVVSNPTGMTGGIQYYFFEHPFEPMEIFNFTFPFPTSLMIWKGGLGIYGGIAGGLLGGLLYVLFNGLSAWQWMDIASPGLLLGQAIGRWGNFFNQELYGPPTTLPWGIPISEAHRLAAYADLNTYPLTTHFHPLFLYESLWNLLGFVLLVLIGRRFCGWLRDGDIFSLYLIHYPLGRLLIESLRPDAWRIFDIPVAQLISIGLLVIGVLLLIWRHHRPRTILQEPPIFLPETDTED